MYNDGGFTPFSTLKDLGFNVEIHQSVAFMSISLNFMSILLTFVLILSLFSTYMNE